MSFLQRSHCRCISNQYRFLYRPSWFFLEKAICHHKYQLEFTSFAFKFTLSKTQLMIYFWKVICGNSNNVYKVKRSITDMKMKFAFRTLLIYFNSTACTNEQRKLNGSNVTVKQIYYTLHYVKLLTMLQELGVTIWDVQKIYPA